jgi:hypothetical protein
VRYIALILGLWLFAAAPSSHAAVPMVKTLAPGFYRTMLGDFEITALNDGVATMQRHKYCQTASRFAVLVIFII